MADAETNVASINLAQESATGNETNKRAVRATVIGVREKKVPTAKAILEEGDEPGKSKQLAEDPFEALMRSGRLIAPPFDLLTLAMLPEHNTELGQCVEAMEVNIEGFGYRFVPRLSFRNEDGKESIDAEVKVLKEKVRLERVRLDNFFMYASMKESFTETRRRTRRDLETTGNGYFEVIRSTSGKIQGLKHIPSYQVRLGRLQDKMIKVEVPILEMQVDGSVQVTKVKSWERFRLFAQSRTIQTYSRVTVIGDNKIRWFKEFGDPRVYDCITGEFETSEKPVPEERRANEVLHFKIYSPRSPYGLPRFIGNLLSIFGDRAAEEINYVTFRNNNIPSMMLLVSNGQLTQGTIERIESFVESQIQGSDNYSKFLIIEAEGEEEGEDSAPVKIDAKQMTETQHKDALFQNYSDNNQDKVRRSFRLPPLLVGRSNDYTRTTAETSRRVADEQIFAPERDDFDSTVNRRMFPDMGVIYHRFKSNSPNTTDNAELVKILGGAEKTGGMTPRIARIMLEDILGQELPPFSEDFESDADMPFSLLMAEAVKNKADPAEPGQQVTALKSLELIAKLTSGDLTEDDEAELAKQALLINHHLEKKWRAEIKKAVDAAVE